MKTLLLLRHGKLSWKDATLQDRERPLKKRGRRDADRMGQEILDRELTIDRIFSSPARRALQTARRVEDILGRPAVEEFPFLYFHGPLEILRSVRNHGDPSENILLVGHNPDLEDLVDSLTGEQPILPTAALVCIDLDIHSWKEIEGERGHLRFVLRPKEL